MTARDKLIFTLQEDYWLGSNAADIADFILADRKRIVAPIMEFKDDQTMTYKEKINAIVKAIEQVAKNVVSYESNIE